jgi:hypothetical protein
MEESQAIEVALFDEGNHVTGDVFSSERDRVTVIDVIAGTSMDERSPLSVKHETRDGVNLDVVVLVHCHELLDQSKTSEIRDNFPLKTEQSPLLCCSGSIGIDTFRVVLEIATGSAGIVEDC